MVSVDTTAVFFPEVMGEWGQPPLAGHLGVAIVCRVKKNSKVRLPSDKLLHGESQPMFFVPPSRLSRIGRPDLDSLSVEGNPPVTMFEQQLPLNLVR